MGNDEDKNGRVIPIGITRRLFAIINPSNSAFLRIFLAINRPRLIHMAAGFPSTARFGPYFFLFFFKYALALI